jgi:hypothetical protein
MNIENFYEWSTHQPLIRAAMELYKPAFVLELGLGVHSTPIFLEYETTLLSIENDKEWLNHIKEKYVGIDTLFHDLGGLKLGTHLYEISEKQKSEITNYYIGLKFPELKPNLLFVDQFTSCRTLSINALKNKFDFIIYHDCQPAGIPWYSYNLINKSGFNSYYLKTPTSWTELMVDEKKDKGFDLLNEIIIPHTNDYKDKNSDCKFMRLEAKY